MKDLSMRLFDITHYLGVPQWVVAEEYDSVKNYFMRTFPHHDLRLYQRRALQRVYDKYEEQLLCEYNIFPELSPKDFKVG